MTHLKNDRQARNKTPEAANHSNWHFATGRGACGRSGKRLVQRAAALSMVMGIAAMLHAAPVVTVENFNELGSAYQKGLNNAALTGLPAGITATFSWNCELMWSPGSNPPGSEATNNIEVGWTPAVPAVTFSKPVILWSMAVYKEWSNTVSVAGKLKGVQVWSYTNSTEAGGAWFTVAAGAGQPMDELDVNCNSWGANFTDFNLSDATGIAPFTNTTPYYVDGANSLASDYNPGTQALPWKTIQWAAARLQAGDTVYIKAGAYSGDVYPANSGNANGWITYSAFPGQEQQAVINQAGFYIEQQSYIMVSGLRIQGSSGWGIGIQGPGANYIISNNYIYNIANSGIAIWGVPYYQDPGQYNFKAITNVLVENNTMEQCCDGGYDEQVTIANGVDSFEVCSNIVKNGINNNNGGEGIDCKAGDSNGKIFGNQIFNIYRDAIYVEAGACDPAYYAVPGVLTNIQVYDNLIHGNASHGICVTSEGLGDINGIRVYNNICYSNGCDGILLYDYNYTSAENYASNITIINNTTYNNNASTNTPYYGGIAIDHKYAVNVVVRNNISYETLQYAYGLKLPSENPTLVQDHNISTASNPGLVNVAEGDFHLKSNSAAVNAGSSNGAPLFDFDGSIRPSGTGFDDGAFEYYPSTPFSLIIQCAPGQSDATLTLQGGPESHYRVDWTPELHNATWTPLQDIPSLPRAPYTLSDTNPISGTAQRFYRAVLLTP
jgi:hypothetical protein